MSQKISTQDFLAFTQKLSTQDFLAFIGHTDLPCEEEERFLIFSAWKDDPSKQILKGTELNFGTYSEVIKAFKRSKQEGFEVLFYDIEQQKIFEIETEWPPLDIDAECLALCDAINLISGLKTYSSCSGHDSQSLKIDFKAETVDSLFILAKCVDRRYGGNGNWNIVVNMTDVNPIVFTLTSGKDVGQSAYTEATKIAGRILKEIAKLD